MVRSRRTVGFAVPLLSWLAAVAWASAQSPAPPAAAVSAPVQTTGGVPAATCAACHASIHDRWAGGRHSKMLQPATPSTVLGPFAGKAIQIRGATFTLSSEADGYFVRGPFPTAKEEVHRVHFTLGSRRVQHYLAKLPDGRLVVLPPTWDVEKREWFHNLDIVNPDEAALNPIQVWNRSCYGCHVSGAEKRFDQTSLAYDTGWIDFGTSCERCHGPGAAHVARYQSTAAPASDSPSIVTPTRLSPERATMVCAQCHSLRDITVPGFAAGNDYYDHFTPILEYAQPTGSDPPYWMDGRPRRFSNDAIGFWQSQCFQKGGATCTACHRDPHEPNIDRHQALDRTSNAMCASCHAPIVTAGTSHTRHAAGSPASACVSCHMPRTVISLRSRMPDHTLSVPAPENTVTHGIPNACTECHQDRDAVWAVAKLAEWFPNGRRARLVARANAFASARRGESSAVTSLIRIATDESEPPLVRANAFGHLRRFPGSKTEAFLAAAASNAHPAVRLTAVLGLGDRGFPAANVTPVLINALGDTHRTVRAGAALSLMNARVTTLEGPAGALLEAAKRDYIARAVLLSDDARVLLDVGKFHLMNKDAAAAIRTLETSLRLDASLHASRYFLALAVLTQGRTADARALLTRIPKNDPYAEAALKLLATLAGGKQR
jgi:hypothetical protein